MANKFLEKFIVKFNNKFASAPDNDKSDFLPLPTHIVLDKLLCVKYTRIIDNGGCFSFNNVIFKVNNCDISSKRKIIILISKKIGITALYNDKTYSVTPILDKDKKQVNSTESVNMIISQFVFTNLLKSERVA
jgi:hypothetical protein